MVCAEAAGNIRPWAHEIAARQRTDKKANPSATDRLVCYPEPRTMASGKRSETAISLRRWGAHGQCTSKRRSNLFGVGRVRRSTGALGFPKMLDDVQLPTGLGGGGRTRIALDHVSQQRASVGAEAQLDECGRQLHLRLRHLRRRRERCRAVAGTPPRRSRTSSPEGRRRRSRDRPAVHEDLAGSVERRRGRKRRPSSLSPDARRTEACCQSWSLSSGRSGATSSAIAASLRSSAASRASKRFRSSALCRRCRSIV